MTFVFIEAPEQIASKESQNNEFIIDIAVKSSSDTLTIFLFGEYILFFFLIQKCIFYSKIYIILVCFSLGLLPFIQKDWFKQHSYSYN